MRQGVTLALEINLITGFYSNQEMMQFLLACASLASVLLLFAGQVPFPLVIKDHANLESLFSKPSL